MTVAKSDALKVLLEPYPLGLTLAEVETKLPEVPRRTLQRWLAQSVESGAIRVEGLARATRYFAVGPALDAREPPAPTYRVISLSPDSRDILAYVSQPIQARKPVGYQPEFLREYEPNATSYLSEFLKRQLRKMGETGSTQRPAGTYGRAVLDRLLIDLSWSSSRLEGNTYSRLDTVALIERGQQATGKDAAEAQMILNHKGAIEMLIDNAEVASFDRYTLLNLHSTLSENLLPDPDDEGCLRDHEVLISQSVFRPLGVPQQVAEFFALFLAKASAIADPFEQAFFAMVHLPYLQPFADVNKRVSRLAANLPLIRANLCPLTFVGVPEDMYTKAILGVYEMTRVELLRDVFVWAYERSTQEYLTLKRGLAEPDPLRLRWRQVVKDSVRRAVLDHDADTVDSVRTSVAALVPEAERENVIALVIDELRRLHEGVLVRYGLRPSDYERWRRAQ